MGSASERDTARSRARAVAGEAWPGAAGAPDAAFAGAARLAGDEWSPTSVRDPGADVEDTDIVRRILDGDEDAFVDLVARYHRKAFWVAFHVLGRAEDARDVVQESFVRLHRSLHRYDFGRNFYTWFYRIVTNLAIDALRKRRSARAVALELVGDQADDADGPTEPFDRDERRAAVWRALDRLDAKFRAVLVLRDLHGLSCREIAPILGVTHATVRWRLHRGRQIFREQWDRLARTET